MKKLDVIINAVISRKRNTIFTVSMLLIAGYIIGFVAIKLA